MSELLKILHFPGMHVSSFLNNTHGSESNLNGKHNWSWQRNSLIIAACLPSKTNESERNQEENWKQLIVSHEPEHRKHWNNANRIMIEGYFCSNINWYKFYSGKAVATIGVIIHPFKLMV